MRHVFAILRQHNRDGSPGQPDGIIVGRGDHFDATRVQIRGGGIFSVGGCESAGSSSVFMALVRCFFLSRARVSRGKVFYLSLVASLEKEERKAIRYSIQVLTVNSSGVRIRASKKIQTTPYSLTRKMGLPTVSRLPQRLQRIMVGKASEYGVVHEREQRKEYEKEKDFDESSIN